MSTTQTTSTKQQQQQQQQQHQDLSTEIQNCSDEIKWTDHHRTVIGLVGMCMCMLTLFMLIYEEQPTPYMDEQFHVDQLHAYCVGNFSYVSKFLICT